MTNRKTTLLIIILLLIAGNVYFGWKYLNIRKELRQTQIVLETKTINGKVLEFTKLFIEKVLKAEIEVDFETRLKLENAVRNLNDEQILNRWQKFVDSKTEAGAQEEIKNLLEMLVSKIIVK